jgi:hypothetical protein
MSELRDVRVIDHPVFSWVYESVSKESLDEKCQEFDNISTADKAIQTSVIQPLLDALNLLPWADENSPGKPRKLQLGHLYPVKETVSDGD